MRLPHVETWRFIVPSLEPPPDFPKEFPFLPEIPGWWGKTPRAACCSWSVAFDPDLESDLPSRPEQSMGRFGELRRGPRSITAENGPAREIWSDQWARKQVLDAVTALADQYAMLAVAEGWVPQVEDPHPYDVPVLRRFYSFVRGE